MFQLTTAYVHQADREREIATDLHTRQLLRSASEALAPVEPPAPSSRAMRRPPVRVRAAGR
jgi:hypothetical protein